MKLPHSLLKMTHQKQEKENNWFTKIQSLPSTFVNIIHKHPYETILFLLVFAYAAFFSFYSIERHLNLYTAHNDLANMDQVVYNTLHGRIFQQTSLGSAQNVSRFATHADIMLVLLAPFYFIYAGPQTLLVIQSVALALGAIPLFALANDILKNKLIAIAIVISYLLYPALEHMNMYEFHAVALATPLLLAAFYFGLKRRFVAYTLCCLFAMTTKEEAPLLVGVMCLFFVFHAATKKTRIYLLILALFSFFLTYLFIWVIIPSARADGSYHFALSYYASFGSSPTGIVKGILKNPLSVGAILWSHNIVGYFKDLFLPTGFIPLIAFPYVFIASSEFAINLLSSSPSMHTIYYQYNAGIIPFIFIALVFGMHIILKMIRTRLHISPIKTITIIFLLYTCSISYFYGLFPGEKKSLWWVLNAQPDKAEAVVLKKQIPPSASVSATNTLAAQFSDREYIYAFPYGDQKADYDIIDDTEPNQVVTHQEIINAIGQLEQDNEYQLVYQKGTMYVFKRMNSGI